MCVCVLLLLSSMVHPTPYMSDDAHQSRPSGYQKWSSHHYNYFTTGAMTCHNTPPTSSPRTMAAVTVGMRSSWFQVHPATLLDCLCDAPHPGWVPTVPCRASPMGLAWLLCPVAVVWWACFEKDAMFGNNQMARKALSFRHHPTLAKNAYSRVFCSRCLCLSLASSRLSLSIEGKGQGLTPMIWIGAPPLLPRLSSP